MLPRDDKGLVIECVARALMRPVRILVFVQTALTLVFTYSLFPRLTPAGILVFVQTAYSLFPRLTPAGILVFVQTALTLVFTYSDSLRAQRGNPVNNNAVANATPYLHKRKRDKIFLAIWQESA